MPLRKQPYLPLYVQDFLTDEKLMECSAQSTGVYIRLMCIMHKSEDYGTILLKQKDKQTDEQNDKQIYNFAYKVAKYMPYSMQIIVSSLKELIEENVIQIDGDRMFQKRMVADDILSNKRAVSGYKGGIRNPFAQANIQAKAQANLQANTENENESENDIVINYNGIMENFHLYCDRMSKISKLSDQRKKHIAGRFKEFNYETIIDVLKKAGKSDFLCGKNDKSWKADFDWIFNPTNFLKIIECKYDNKVERTKFVF